MSTTTSRVSEINLVVIPSTDQERAIEFYIETLGFEKRTDVEFGDGQYRWVEVYPPKGTTGIALAPPRPQDDRRPDRHQPGDRRHRRHARPSEGEGRRRRRRGVAHGRPGAAALLVPRP